MNIAMHKYKRLWAVILFLGILTAVFEWSGLRGHLSLEFVQHTILENQAGGLLVFILLFSLGNLIQIPGWLFLAAAVLAMGRAYGGMATYIAACISCALTFLVIRFVGGNALRQLDSKIALNILGRLDVQPVQSVLVLRVLFQTMPALNYALAMSGIRFRKYLIGTVLGLPAPIFLYCLFFDYLARMLRLV